MSTNLTDAPNAGSLSTDEKKVSDWRQKQLEDAGYSTLHAKKIAARHSGPDAIDLHKAIELVKPLDPERKSADPHVAADILL